MNWFGHTWAFGLFAMRGEKETIGLAGVVVCVWAMLCEVLKFGVLSTIVVFCLSCTRATRGMRERENAIFGCKALVI